MQFKKSVGKNKSFAQKVTCKTKEFSEDIINNIKINQYETNLEQLIFCPLDSLLVLSHGSIRVENFNIF